MEDYVIQGQSRRQPHTCYKDQGTKIVSKQKEMSREGNQAGQQGCVDTEDHEGRWRWRWRWRWSGRDGERGKGEGEGRGGKERGRGEGECVSLRMHISAIPTSKPNLTKLTGLHFQSLDI